MSKTMAFLSKQSSIGIIGAGPAGLASAEALSERGFKNVTILEKNNRVGGMSLSLSYHTPQEKKIIYEMGSLQPISSKLLYKLIHRYHLHVGKSLNQNGKESIFLKIYSLEKQKPIIDFTKYKLGYPIKKSGLIISDLIKFIKYLYRYRSLSKPGFNVNDNLLKELAIPFEQWVDEKQFYIIGDMLKMLGSTTTFSNPESRFTIPAMIPMKYFQQLFQLPLTHLRYINGKFKLMKEGYQELWNRVAQQHNVLLNVNILKIHRNNQKVEVRLKNDTLYFDKIIITCSPVKALKFLDITDDEKSLFTKVRYSSGWRVAFLGKNLPHDAVYAFYEPYMTNQYGPCLQCFYPEGEVEKGIWLYSGIVTLNKNESIHSIQEEANKTLKKQFNGEIIQWLNSVYWSEYVPYFDGIDIQNGIYKKFDTLQGKNDTYYGGGLLSSSTHASVVDHAYDMVKKYFGGPVS